MASPKFVFYLTCFFFAQMADLKFSSSGHHEGGSVTVKTGGNLTLQCSREGNHVARFYWYRQALGQKLRLICTSYKYETNPVFHGEFKNPRFALDTEKSNNHLKITDVQILDSATYYCANSKSNTFEFIESITVSVQGSGLNVSASVQQSASETIQPGGSVTLNCTVHTGTCDGEHSVYLFKSSEESHPGLIYTRGGRDDQCERKPSTQTHSCVYNLPMKSLNLSRAETYYCAVASCGRILFGDGTKLDFDNEADYLVLVYFLSGALAVTIFLNVLLVFLLFVISKKSSCICAESHATPAPSPSTTHAEDDQHEENIHYAAISEFKRYRRQRNNSNTECTYSSIKL